MKYAKKLMQGVLIKRYKRFLADIYDAHGNKITIYCPNTGAMTHCGKEGDSIWYSYHENPKRKYAYTWEQVQGPHLYRIGINSQYANTLVEEALNTGVIEELALYDSLQREVPFHPSQAAQLVSKEIASPQKGKKKKPIGRADFQLTMHDGTQCIVEVKSVTLGSGETDGDSGIGYFPDAVSVRGQRHLRELVEVVRSGRRAVLCFCVQHHGIKEVRPADHVDKRYGELLRIARQEGVELIAYAVKMSATESLMTHSLPVILA